MPRIALSVLFVVVVVAGSDPAGAAIDPHLDTTVVTTGCQSCHAGHGRSGSPMLRAPQRDVCLACHGTQAGADLTTQGGDLAVSARPTLLADSLSQPYGHPLTEGAFSRHDAGAVTCTSCHSPHRSDRAREDVDRPLSGKRFSSRNPQRFEYELCGDCHGNAGIQSQDPADISRRLDPNSRSFHPVQAPARELSPSVLPELSGLEISCTHCHGNSDPRGARGLHGSSVRHLLRAEYRASDGVAESPTTYTLCYRCHDRDRVLDSTLFPEHRRHVVDLRASCSTCHDPHGAIDARALIRYEETLTPGSVMESSSTGILAFESDAPGAGTCWLSCHGYDHGPESYGGAQPLLEPLRLRQDAGALPLETGPRSPRPSRPRIRRDDDGAR